MSTRSAGNETTTVILSLWRAAKPPLLLEPLRERTEGKSMPRIVEQPRAGSGVMAMNSEKEACRAVRVGQNCWVEIRDQIDVTWIGKKRFYSDAAINEFLRKQTRKAKAAAPAAPAPGRRRKGAERETPTAQARSAPRVPAVRSSSRCPLSWLRNRRDPLSVWSRLQLWPPSIWKARPSPRRWRRSILRREAAAFCAYLDPTSAHSLGLSVQLFTLCSRWAPEPLELRWQGADPFPSVLDRKSTRLNSSHLGISYAVFCLK